MKGNQHGISCARLSDVDLRGNQRWRSEMSAVFSGRSENESEAKILKEPLGQGVTHPRRPKGSRGMTGLFNP